MTLPRPPIRDESFLQYWKYAQRKYYWSKKKSLARYLVTFLAQVLFFGLFLFLSYGVLYSLSRGLLRTMLDRLPQPVVWWRQCSGFLLAGAATDLQKVLRLLGTLYGLPLTAALLICLPIYLCYHPKAPRLPEKPLQQARELWVTAKHIRSYEEKAPSRAYVFCGMFLGISAAGLIVMFFLVYARKPQIAAMLRANAGRASLYFVLAVFGVFAAYWLFHLPLFLVLKALTSCRLPKDFCEITESYYKLIQGRNRQNIRDNLNAEAEKAARAQEEMPELPSDPQPQRESSEISRMEPLSAPEKSEPEAPEPQEPAPQDLTEEGAEEPVS